jgi:dihydrolipoamide dehydrogenase
MSSTGALELRDVPARLLVVGGGIIGLELATVYAALGSRITVVELTDTLLPGTDPDLVRPLQRRIAARYEHLLLGTRVVEVKAQKNGLVASFAGKQAPEKAMIFDRVLVAVGRRPNGDTVNAPLAGVSVDERGFIPVDDQQRTNVAHIFAIGDVARPPMLAHKASFEGKVAAEVAAGLRSGFDASVIPSVAYTDPEIAWVGITELEAKAQSIALEKATYPWAASGRSLALGRDEGMTKLLFDPETHRLVGGGIVGSNAGELIGEVGHAIEMGSTASDLALTIHAHPTLSETIAFAAEVLEGTVVDIYAPKRKAGKRPR